MESIDSSCRKKRKVESSSRLELILLDANNDTANEIHSFLHWTDRVKLGSTNKALQKTWIRDRDRVLEPVLECLNELCHADKNYPRLDRVESDYLYTFHCESIEEEDHPLFQYDPRYKADYPEWTTYAKCSALTSYIKSLVKGLRDHLMGHPELSDLGDKLRYLNEAFLWYQDLESTADLLFFMKNFPLRSNLAYKLVVIAAFQDMLARDQTLCVVPRPERNKYAIEFETLGSGLGLAAVYGELNLNWELKMLLEMNPFKDDDLIKFFRNKVLPSQTHVQVLGDAMTSYLCLNFSFFSWVQDDGEVKIPVEIEPLKGDLPTWDHRWNNDDSSMDDMANHDDDEEDDETSDEEKAEELRSDYEA